jgi:hypothetical protein
MIHIADIHWAAGFIEGEGTFAGNKRTGGGSVFALTASQVQREPLERLQKVFGGSINRYQRKNKKHKPIYMWLTNGKRAASVMMTLYTLMSPWRQEQIRKALSIWMTLKIDNKDLTHCLQGHPYDATNTVYSKSGQRRCKICCRNWVMAYHRRIGVPARTLKTSHFKGVSTARTLGGWRGRIRTKDGTELHLGSFSYPEAAAVAVNLAAYKYDRPEMLNLVEMG